MKIGQENRVELVIAVVLGIGAVLALFYAFKSPSPSAPAATSAPATTPAQKGALQASSLDPTLRLELLSSSEQVEYTGKGRNIFSAAPAPEDIPKPVQSPIKNQPEVPKVYTPPPPPPIDLKFFGFANRKGEQPSIFLAQGENVFIARQGDIVNRRYRVLRISPNAVEIEDVLNNNRQSIPLTQG